jgi:lysine biosynthesis protein LysW
MGAVLNKWQCHPANTKGEKSMSSKVVCPSCASAVTFGNKPQIHQHVTCKVCGSAAEIIGIDPVELDWTSIAKLENQEKERIAPFPMRFW